MATQEKVKKYYIQYRYRRLPLETVDECTNRKDALHLLKEYRLSNPYGYYYISSRACNHWKE